MDVGTFVTLMIGLVGGFLPGVVLGWRVCPQVKHVYLDDLHSDTTDLEAGPNEIVRYGRPARRGADGRRSGRGVGL
jgi:hypothetical protein